jgi:nucleotide-binding universal stress UspA family protein
MDAIRTILVTTDFSETSLRAIEPARFFARRFSAAIVVLYVEDDRYPPLVCEYMAVSLEDLRLRQERESKVRLDEFVREHFRPDDRVEAVVRLGTPHVEVVRLAAERAVDLIVIATPGRGFISHAIMGSTTERVLRRAPCPVLVVRAADADS